MERVLDWRHEMRGWWRFHAGRQWLGCLLGFKGFKHQESNSRFARYMQSLFHQH